MLRRTGVALAAAMLLLPLTVVAQKGGRSRSSSSRSSSSSTSHNRKSTSIKSAPHRTSGRKKSTVAQRDSNGRIRRSSSARADFIRRTGYPKGRKGYVVDHIVPLECGGAGRSGEYAVADGTRGEDKGSDGEEL